MISCVEDELACDVSVVVPTYNRQALLRRTLETLLSQDAAGITYEVLVVDNNSSDGTRAAVQAIGRDHRHLKYLFEARQGVSHARNKGIAAARAPVVAFIDDDVEAGPTWVAAIKHAFDAHPEVDCVGGLIAPRWAVPPPSWLTPMFWAAVALQAGKGDQPYIDADHATPCLMTANFACRRSALQEVGGFAVDYLRDEDRELQLRLWAAGKRGLYVPDVAVTTEVPEDRLTRRFHREFYARVGRSHARMRYLDRIDAAGRLLRDGSPATTILGTPAFIYRYVFRHAASLAWTLATLRWNRAFFHETRLLYYANYIGTRYREDEQSVRAIPRELYRLLVSLIQRHLRKRASGSVNTRPPDGAGAGALSERSVRT